MATTPNPAPTATQAATIAANATAQGHAAPPPQLTPQQQLAQLGLAAQQRAMGAAQAVQNVNPTVQGLQNAKAAGINTDILKAPPPALAPIAAPPSQILAPTAVTPGMGPMAATQAALARYIQSTLGQAQALSQHVQPGHFLIGPNIGQLMSGLNGAQAAIEKGSVTPGDQSQAAASQYASQSQAASRQNAAQIDEYRALMDAVSRTVNASMLTSLKPISAAGQIYAGISRGLMPATTANLMSGN